MYQQLLNSLCLVCKANVLCYLQHAMQQDVVRCAILLKKIVRLQHGVFN